MVSPHSWAIAVTIATWDNVVTWPSLLGTLEVGHKQWLYHRSKLNIGEMKWDQVGWVTWELGRAIQSLRELLIFAMWAARGRGETCSSCALGADQFSRQIYCHWNYETTLVTKIWPSITAPRSHSNIVSLFIWKSRTSDELTSAGRALI
jgi:hypothetical protein